MLNRIAFLPYPLLVALLAGGAHAALDGSEPFLCAITQTLECDSDGNCTRGSADDVNLPDFLWVDVPARKLREHGGERSTEIQNQLRRDGQLVLQGVEERAWSVSISEQTGRFTATAAAANAGFVLFGVCTTP